MEGLEKIDVDSLSIFDIESFEETFTKPKDESYKKTNKSITFTTKCKEIYDLDNLYNYKMTDKYEVTLSITTETPLETEIHITTKTYNIKINKIFFINKFKIKQFVNSLNINFENVQELIFLHENTNAYNYYDYICHFIINVLKKIVKYRPLSNNKVKYILIYGVAIPDGPARLNPLVTYLNDYRSFISKIIDLIDSLHTRPILISNCNSIINRYFGKYKEIEENTNNKESDRHESYTESTLRTAVYAKCVNNSVDETKNTYTSKTSLTNNGISKLIAISEHDVEYMKYRFEDVNIGKLAYFFAISEDYVYHRNILNFLELNDAKRVDEHYISSYQSRMIPLDVLAVANTIIECAQNFKKNPQNFIPDINLDIFYPKIEYQLRTNRKLLKNYYHIKTLMYMYIRKCNNNPLHILKRGGKDIFEYIFSYIDPNDWKDKKTEMKKDKEGNDKIVVKRNSLTVREPAWAKDIVKLYKTHVLKNTSTGYGTIQAYKREFYEKFMDEIEISRKIRDGVIGRRPNKKKTPNIPSFASIILKNSKKNSKKRQKDDISIEGTSSHPINVDGCNSDLKDDTLNKKQAI